MTYSSVNVLKSISPIKFLNSFSASADENKLSDKICFATPRAKIISVPGIGQIHLSAFADVRDILGSIDISFP